MTEHRPRRDGRPRGSPGRSARPPGASAWSTTTDLLTPPDLLVALGALRQTDEGYDLGPDPFDLDPATSVRQPWPTARTMWTVHEDGMQRDWKGHGEIWGNFPYGNALYAWLARLADHGSGVALCYARTETKGFHSHVWGRADAVFFFGCRIWFHLPVTGEQAPHNCGGPTLLVCYGERSVARCRRLAAPGSAYPGHLVRVRHATPGRVVTDAPAGKRRT